MNCRTDGCGETEQTCRACGATVKPDALDKYGICVPCQRAAVEIAMRRDLAE